MKEYFLKLSIIPLMLMMIFTLSANAENIGSGNCGTNITWTLDDKGTLTLSGTGEMTDFDEDTCPWGKLVTDIKYIEISEGITNIGDLAFANTYITSARIPEGVTNIGDQAFAYCPYLEEVIIPDSVITIEEAAFNRSVNLSEISIGNKLNLIGNAAFEGCESLEKINIHDIESWCNITFDGITSSSPLCYGNLYINNEPITNVVIPQTVTRLNNYAFYGSDTITEVTIPTSVTSFGLLVFSSCPNLKKVNFPSNLTSIPEYMFIGCTGLTEIEFPENITTIGKAAFERCGFTSLTIPDHISVINEAAFRDCKYLKDLTIGSGITSIGKEAFNRCDILESIYWKASNVTDAEEDYNGVFGAGKRDYNNLTLIFADGVTKIPAYMFYRCTGLANVVISDSVKSIGTFSFYGCNNMKEFTIGKGVASIGKAAFSGCTAVDKISWNAVNVADFTANNYIFSSCGKDNQILEVVFGESVTRIPAYAFYPSSGVPVKNITMETGISSIGNYAFCGCTNLTTIFYVGTKYDLQKVTVGSNNNYFKNASKYYTKKVTAGFDINVNTGVSSSTTVVGGKNITISSEVPKRTGYTFLGWATTENAESPEYQPGDTISTNKATEDFVLYAVWDKTSYTTTTKTSTGFSVTPTGIAPSSSIILACYKDGNYVKFYEKNAGNGSAINFDVNVLYDHVKVIVLENINSMIPLSECEKIDLKSDI